MIKPYGRSYIVYKHTNRKNGKVYIGITCQTPERRWQKGAGYAGTYFGNAIKKYGWDAFEHEVLEEGLEEEKACERERMLIVQYHSNNHKYGYNLSGGGEVMDCITPLMGKDNPKAVAVVRTNPTTNEKTVFPSVADACREMGINHRGISKACRGIAKTYMGYVWEYASGDFKKPFKLGRGKHPHTCFLKPVKMTDTNGNIHKFGSIGEAAKYVGAKPANVSRYLIGTRRDATGRKWEYA
jgi:predicted GIY-YIG superfamily endonuclease